MFRQPNTQQLLVIRMKPARAPTGNRNVVWPQPTKFDVSARLAWATGSLPPADRPSLSSRPPALTPPSAAPSESPQMRFWSMCNYIQELLPMSFPLVVNYGPKSTQRACVNNDEAHVDADGERGVWGPPCTSGER